VIKPLTVESSLSKQTGQVGSSYAPRKATSFPSSCLTGPGAIALLPFRGGDLGIGAGVERVAKAEEFVDVRAGKAAVRMEGAEAMRA
jgi:hypothetical protein